MNESQTYEENTSYDETNINIQIEYVMNNISIMIDQLFKDLEEGKPYHIQLIRSILNSPNEQLYEELKLLNKKYNENLILVQNALQELFVYHYTSISLLIFCLKIEN